MMIEWNDSYSVGVKSYDQHHKELFTMMNTLCTGIRENRKKEDMLEVLNGLLDYTAYHFAAEERAMKENGYPEYEAHKKEHDDLTLRAEQFYGMYNEGTKLLTIEVLEFSSNWLKNHIAVTDKKYAAFFKQKGVK